MFSEVIVFCNPKNLQKRKFKYVTALLTSKLIYNVKLVTDTQELINVKNACICVLGGDGTIHKAINNANIQSNVFSFIGLGSGNDFLKNFNTKNLFILIEKINNQQYEACDLLKCNNVFAINAIGAGFDAYVAKSALKSKIPGSLKYALIVLKDIFSYQSNSVLIKTNNQLIEGEIFLLGIGNGAYAGGGFKLYPKANLNDGLLEILLIKKIRTKQVFQYFWKVRNGSHINLKLVNYFNSNGIQIISKSPINFELDGEIYTFSNVEINVLKNAIKIIV